MEGFEEYREAARAGVIGAGAEPIMAEDFPSSAATPRNACLDQIGTCDVYVCIVGNRGGWKAPSGKLVTEDEFDHARRIGLPVFVFGVDGPRDANAEDFFGRISDYVGGRFRVLVQDPGDLRSRLPSALDPVLKTLSLPVTDERIIGEILTAGSRTRDGDPLLRVVVAPIRDEELIDPVRLADPAFTHAVLGLAHRADVQLLDYGLAKDNRVEGSSLRIKQHGGERAGRDDNVLLEIRDSGLAVIDQTLRPAATGRRTLNDVSHMVVQVDDIQATLERAFGFYLALIDMLDPHGRHQGFVYNGAIIELGYRNIVREVPRGSVSMRMWAGDEPILAFDKPRPLTRQLLSDPEPEVSRFIAVVEQKAKRN